MSTALSLITGAMEDIGVLAGGESPSNDDAQMALIRLNRMVDTWANERLTIYTVVRTTFSLVASTQTYTIGSGGTINIARPQFIEAAGLILTTPSPDIEIPLPIITDQEWELIGIKALTSTIPTALYYDYADTSGLGNIKVWPVPTDVNDVALYVPTALTQFAALTTSYTFPPGYESALEYNLALRLCLPFGQQASNDLQTHAAKSLAVVKRANHRIVELSVDPALWGRGPGYNWRSDTFGGG